MFVPESAYMYFSLGMILICFDLFAVYLVLIFQWSILIDANLVISIDYGFFDLHR